MTTLQQFTTFSNSDSDLNGNKSLPTARATLTTLINAIAAIPLLPRPNADPGDKIKPNPKASLSKTDIHDTSSNTNPLRRVPPSHRHLLITLHVLFPGLVLPALDLLERGLVARVALHSSTTGHGDGGRGSGGAGDVRRVREAAGGGVAEGVVAVEEGAAALDGEMEGEGKGEGEKVRQGEESKTATTGAAAAQRGEGCFYLVQSTAAAAAEASSRERMRRRRKHSDGYGSDGRIGTGETETAVSAAKGYFVRLEAWHCSCAAFAFASVQGGDAERNWEIDGGEEWEQEGLGYEISAAAGEGSGEVEADMEWSFGGMSFDGLTAGTGEGVPLCKHMLACLLAERWSAALGRYVVERKVGREEMAGIVADV
jgi:hypothetical protein